MRKPKPKRRKEYLNYNDCRDFIEKKYKIDLRNYAKHQFTGKKDDPPYQDFWHWIVDKYEVRNGGELYFDPAQVLHEQKLYTEEGKKQLEEFYKYAPPWVCEICELWVKEFPHYEPPWWCEW